MPITIVGTTNSRVGLVSSSMGEFTSSLDGTHTGPGSAQGRISSMLGDYSSLLQGQFGQPVAFDGNIASVLGDFVSSLGDFNVQEQDWQNRIQQPGIVWYHDFRNEAEVDQFRWTGTQSWGNDPTDIHPNILKRDSCRWQTSDGITGGACLEQLRRAGTTDGSEWWRPFNAFSSGHGRTTADPAASGTIATVPWVATPSGEETRLWTNGFYGHENFQTSVFDGTDYWIQTRVKLHPNRPQEPSGGKLFYFTRTDLSLTNQELVTKSKHNSSVHGDEVFWVYRGGSFPLTGDPPNDLQPNREIGTFTPNSDGYWSWPFDQWITLMYHVRGGLNGNGDTLFQVWVDWDGLQKVDSFIKIWDQPTVDISYGSSDPFGWNAIIASGYMNGINFSQDIWQRYDQIIFSKLPVACPMDAESVLAQKANSLSADGQVPFTPNSLQRNADIKWQTKSIYYDPIHRELQYVGKPASSESNDWKHYLYKESTDNWIDKGVVTNSPGHNWSACMDPVNGDYYFNEGGGTSNSDKLHWYDRINDTWSQITLTGLNTTVGVAAISYHPNLFGAGYPGVFVWGSNNFYAVNTYTRAVTNVGSNPGSPTTSDFANMTKGTGDYCFSRDSLILSATDFNTGVDRRTVVEVLAGAGNSSDVLGDSLVVKQSDLKTFSIPAVWSGSPGTASTKLVAHPDNSGRMLLLEEKGSARVWRSDNGGATWSSDGTHPFDSQLNPKHQDHWTVGAIPEYKVFVGMSSGASPGDAHLWRPN